MYHFDDKNMQEYFNSLPAFIQENIIQSGAKINSLEQMKSCAEAVINQKK